MLRLASDTDPEWIGVALAGLDEVVLDHAHLEKKAASHALAIIFRYPEQSELQRPLSRLAREELEHFELLLDHLDRRGVRFDRIRPSRYAERLRSIEQKSEPGRFLDALLMAAVIEARSCERMKLLSETVPDPALAKLYRGLLASEARHHQLYVDLASKLVGEGIALRRLGEIVEHEAKILDAPPREPRIHG
ncbi:MAG: tRNA-(ms[2]io[6]A)-hydroxylase [Deltaproteobacteria bacterium]|nr:tRNA-(ms[2]io[6]A)-hydroxylase [Deltaproteobacteria bacterium]